jgi:hypothetical protein
MNYTLIILGTILVVIVYILYKVIDEKGRSVASKIDLKSQEPEVRLSSVSGNPTSPRYYISSWIYIKTLPANTSLFKIANGNSATYLDVSMSNTASLSYEINATTNATHTIMDNFPLQKWVFLIISVDNNIVDLYIDGKLLRSHKIAGTVTAINEASSINFGNNIDGFLAKMEREPRPISPSEAWDKYMDGNGGNYFSKMFANYGGTVTLTKDDLDVRQFQMF